MFLTGLMLASALAFDAGADLRIRQEVMDHVPGMPNGGVLCPKKESGYINHIRYRPRVWGELTAKDTPYGNYRLYLRLTDEMREYVRPSGRTYTWPDEVIIDNLLFEGTHIGGFFDFAIGRQDIYNLYGLDHVFVDGTPGDGSRTVYADLARVTFHLGEESRLDLFTIFNADDNVLRWGTRRGNHRRMTGLGGGAEPEMDDYGFGAVWGSKFAEWFPYQVFAIEKDTRAYHRAGVRHTRTRRDMLGVKLVPQLNDEFSLQLEAMGQFGRNGSGDTLSGWSSYAGVNWKQSGEVQLRPFAKLGYHYMSGDKDAANEDGGHQAWDPMWARGVNDSELMLYGSHYGAAWWSNQHYIKLIGGLDLGRRHTLCAHMGPLFAAEKDGMGGGSGAFKGFLEQIRYDFPIYLADSTKGERFEVFGHLLAEVLHPGDYFESDKTAWFVRWQIDFKF